MKLYYHPISTTSRPVMLFAADRGLALDYQVVDLFTGDQQQPTFSAINPSQCVPVLQDGEFRLSEVSAILKYLADRNGCEAYPAQPQQRARINERMDWFNTFLSRELCYGFIYPQLFTDHRRADAQAQAHTLAWARPRARRWLGVLDEHVIGPNNDFVCGDRLTLADYLGIAMLTLGEAVHLDYGHWRNVSRWIAAMKARPSFAPVHEAFYMHVVAPAAAASFEAL